MVLLACGTSWHAALVGKFLIEHLAGLPAEVDYGSEFRYRTPLVGPGTVAVAISQSGETADTLAAFREAKARGALPPRHLQRAGLDADAGGGGVAPHPRRARDRRRLDEGLHRAARRALAPRPPPRAAAGHALRRRPAASTSPQLTRIPHLMELALEREPEVEELSRALSPRPRLPLPRARRQLPDRPRGRAQAEGDLVPARRGLPGRRDEARADRPRRRGPPGGGAVPARPRLREDAVERPGGEGPRGSGDRGRPPPATRRSRSSSTGRATRSSRSPPAPSCGRRSSP